MGGGKGIRLRTRPHMQRHSNAGRAGDASARAPCWFGAWALPYLLELFFVDQLMDRLLARWQQDSGFVVLLLIVVLFFFLTATTAAAVPLMGLTVAILWCKV